METCSRRSCCNTFCTSPKRHEFGDKLFYQLGVRLAQAVDQALGFLAREQFVRILPDQFS